MPLPLLGKIGIATAGKAVGVPAAAAVGAPIAVGAAIGGAAVWAAKRKRKKRK